MKFPKEYFQAGVEPEDLPALFPLLRARDAVDAFIALFRGTDEDVLIRLLVLREIGRRGEQPVWTPQELHVHFAYLDETKLQTVLHRLRDTGLLVWDQEASNYQVSPHGRMALSAFSVLLKFSTEEEGEIGYITSQLAAGQALGKVSDEDLQHLLSRLNELKEGFDRAVLSGSELRISRVKYYRPKRPRCALNGARSWRNLKANSIGFEGGLPHSIGTVLTARNGICNSGR